MLKLKKNDLVDFSKGHSDYWTFELLGFRSIGLSDYWDFRLSDYCAFRLSGLRTIGLLDYRAFGLLGRHRVIRALRIVQKLCKDRIKPLYLNSTTDQKYFWKNNQGQTGLRVASINSQLDQS